MSYRRKHCHPDDLWVVIFDRRQTFLHVVRIKEIKIRAGAYDIDLYVSSRWNPGGDFLLHLVGGFPETVDLGMTTQVLYDVCSHYYRRSH